MKTEMSQTRSPLLTEMVLASLPKLEDLPESNRQELIQALAALLLHDPDLQALWEVRYEPEQ
jgi:hypothetical protein